MLKKVNCRNLFNKKDKNKSYNSVSALLLLSSAYFGMLHKNWIQITCASFPFLFMLLILVMDYRFPSSWKWKVINQTTSHRFKMWKGIKGAHTSLDCLETCGQLLLPLNFSCCRQGLWGLPSMKDCSLLQQKVLRFGWGTHLSHSAKFWTDLKQVIILWMCTIQVQNGRRLYSNGNFNLFPVSSWPGCNG